MTCSLFVDASLRAHIDLHLEGATLEPSRYRRKNDEPREPRISMRICALELLYEFRATWHLPVRTGHWPVDCRLLQLSMGALCSRKHEAIASRHYRTERISPCVTLFS